MRDLEHIGRQDGRHNSNGSELLAGILRIADKHPQSRIAKLIRSVEEDRTQKNIVLLMIELAENAEYASNFDITLKYYSDLFEQLANRCGIVLNEAGLFVLNLTKVYARRVDYLHDQVARQILTLSNADQEITAAKEAEKEEKDAIAAKTTEKPKRTCKRPIEAPTDPYEVELVPRKFRKISEEKRFAIIRSPMKTPKSTYRHAETEQYLHPAIWKHAFIADLENDEEIDSKRNYKLFTFQVEHRYNTLVPDINFRLHFKVKDYIDEEEERLQQECSMTDASQWPPLSEEYVNKYLDLEDKALEDDLMPLRKRSRLEDSNVDNSKSKELLNSTAMAALKTVQNLNLNDENPRNDDSFGKDSGLGESLLGTTKSDASANNSRVTTDTSIQDDNEDGDTSANTTALKEVQNSTAMENSFLNSSKDSGAQSGNNDTTEMSTLDESKMLDESERSKDESSLANGSMEKSVGDSALGESLNSTEELTEDISRKDETEEDKGFESMESEDINDIVENLQPQKRTERRRSSQRSEKSLTHSAEKRKPVENDEGEINLNEVRVLLPHLDDEGVYFSDLDEQDHRMLSPTVLATDVLPCVPNKEKITIIVDDEIKALLNLPDDEPETYMLPVQRRPPSPQLLLNIFQIPEKCLKRRVLFRLGPDMDIYLQARTLKRTKNAATLEANKRLQPAKWYPLNNTDMNGVCMTPLPSPGHGSENDFIGFSESDDDMLEDFHGFSEEEQIAGKEKVAAHRLSRDSGVGADSPLISPKCTLETITEAFDNATEEMLDLMNINIEEMESPNKADIGDEPAEPEQKELDTNKEKETTNEENVSADYNECNPGEQSEDMSIDAEEASPCESGIDLDFSTELNENLAEIELSYNKTKIQKWHEHIQPILAKSRERHHFDVFKIGTEIIDTFHPENEDEPSTSTPKTITFQDVMDNKDPSFVSRYFLSSLLLANQNNIKITVNNQNSNEPSAWHDVQFELLSTKRHTVAIEDNIGMVNVKPTASVKPQISAKLKQIDHLEMHKAPGHSSNSSIAVSKPFSLNREILNVNLQNVQPLTRIEKSVKVNDDSDSGVFSIEEYSS